jgi:hypothetical protein
MCVFHMENEVAATSPERNKAPGLKAFDALFNKRDYAAAERFWSETYIQHGVLAGRDRFAILFVVFPTRSAFPKRDPSSHHCNGARCRRLDGLDAFEGASGHFWASPVEARLCAGQEVAVMVGGNSAGQAVVYLASQVGKVSLLVREDSLRSGRSRYLVDRIRKRVAAAVGEGAQWSRRCMSLWRYDRGTKKGIE